ncbi:radical SAM protein [Schwartzia succinivorans]|uniref:Radical SAM superfamily protein n=1 Tax=Schwartzia succinivorans DSM 10502 TaxID=1123243 RepID=A0A1M4ZJQ7_9FIRM|nr:radical SAM protein [Schwartzia succinivorans]MBQ1469491.1 radical SAM protein [Schwartzia sp. (in: firmicutes)]MBE6096893.1 radical SAM protein [Schwartzia succinivorans]MBQ3862932.1 radical SAM protein [Schwartzia sp. (in: firmicutes)]MBQ5414445.1 radical SAM protein [Schwartzia sp. (in: firmicutes)]MDY6296627.1 radical SAM protein [Schwartzia succinivorans]
MFFDSYDTPVFRPPSEARSFILRVTRGCAHNKCKYCNMYEGVQFQVLTEEEVDRQIMMAANFNKRGVRRVFLADGDALVLSTERLLAILKKLRETFPNFERCASYAAPKDVLRKSVEELRMLREAGLELLYYGMESGDSETLAAVNKGVDGEESIEVGKRVKAAGMKLSMMIILGLAGREGSKRHALATAHAISEIRPTMLGAICLMLYRGSELKEQFERGEFDPLPPAGLMEELRMIIENVNLPEDEECIFRSNHISNYVPLAATLPQDKEQLLDDIDYSITELKKLKDWDVYNHDKYGTY